MYLTSRITTCAVLLCTLVLGQSDGHIVARTPPPPEGAYLPRIYGGRRFSGFHQKDIPIDGNCTPAGSDLFHGTSSIYIPCPAQAPENKKVLCTMYLDQSCTAPIVSFDQSHDELTKDTAGLGYSVGTQLSAVKCEEVDISTPARVLNGNYDNHPSIALKSACPGDSCESDKDCPPDKITRFRCGKSESKTCMRAFYLDDNARCDADEECEAGICAGRDYYGKATLDSFCSERRAPRDFCEVGSECPNNSPLCCVSRFIKDEQPNAKPRCDDKEACTEQGGSSCKPNDELCSANSSCCSGYCGPSEIFFIPVCQ